MIIVTGAAGFIGSNIVAELQDAGRGPIAVIDWFGEENKWRNLVKRNIAAFVAPEQTLSFLDNNATKIESIIHMGAITATTEKNVDLLVERNINYSVMLWDWCTQHKVPFIYASSAATYGALESLLKDDDSIEALSKLRPLNPYGWSKNATDLIFAQRIADGKTPPQWVGLKFFNVYGPNEYHKGDMRSVITKFYDDIQTWGAVKLFKSDRPDIDDGQQKRDFVYVKDCSQAVLWFVDHPAVSGIFNMGTGNARSFIDLVKAMEKTIGKPVEISFKDMPEELKSRYQYYTEADMGKARSAGLNVSFRSLEAGITDYIENYLSNPDSYR
jgi:ADP-L-glycero-D-manno-heptose 6-epimerase